MTELGGVVAVVPIRGLDSGKTRLAGTLPADARGALIRRLLRGVVRAAGEVAGIHAVAVVSPDPAALAFASAVDRRVVPLPETTPTPGLNAAADTGRAWAIEDGAAACLVLFGDLPLLSGDDLRRLITAGDRSAVTIATDRHGTGTNALLLRLDGGVAGPAHRFRFGFGEGSAARHAEEAARLGLTSARVMLPGIAFDLDTPEDWRMLLASMAGSDPAPAVPPGRSPLLLDRPLPAGDSA